MVVGRVGILGCGNISAIYLKNCKMFNNLDILAVADLNPERSKARAEEYEIPVACTPEQLFSNPDIDVILNLTLPGVHYETSKIILESGKHVYVEKPLAINIIDGLSVMDIANKNQLRVGAAPDTFLGAGLQTCRKLLDDGWIGKPIAATANMLCHGHEHWHPDPVFYYKQGGGPLFDMGPYYLTALVSLLGPVCSVQGLSSKSFPVRQITSAPKFGTEFEVEIPTHLAALLLFECGAICTLTMSFDVWSHNQPCLEIYGSEGTLCLPDPNTFGGPVRLRRGREKEWSEIPLSHPYSENSRGLGLAEMMYADYLGAQHRANGDIALHVLEIMCAVESSSLAGSKIQISSRVERPAQMLMNLRPNSVEPI